MKKLNEDGEYEFGVYEVYYDSHGKIVGWTETAVSPLSSSEESLLHELEIMKQAFKEETLLHE
ncbi:hypothetical protein SAMN05518672_1011372 [Chitinophaga sp. CF118]|nr:hypothetical protein SAMN05518672_1011372 [Chitinophaga sp. CF118]